MKQLFISFFCLFICVNALAQSLEERLNSARNKKAVVETKTGYLKAAKNDAATKVLVKEVNEARKAKYLEIKKETKGATLESVEKSAGAKLMQKYGGE